MGSRLPFIERAIAAVAPGYALSRMQSRMRLEMASGAYKGASMDRSALAGWNIPRGAPDDLAARDLPTLRRNAADLERNNPLAAGAISTKVSGVVGTGLKLQASIDREALGLSDEAADAWEAGAERFWGIWSGSKDCHVQGQLNFAQQQELAWRCTLSAGDHFVQLATAEASALPFRLALQHIAAARVSNPQNRSDTDTLSQGIERSPAGRRIRAHVLDRHPEALRTRTGIAWGGGQWMPVEFYDAAQRPLLLQLYRPTFADQTRGMPDLTPVIEPLKQLDRYSDAEIDAAVKNAIWAVLVKTSTGVGMAGMGIDDWASTRKQYYQDAPVAVREGQSHVLGLFPDDDVISFDPNRPNAGYEGFIQAAFANIGNALELPRDVLTKAFQSSYSAARAALLQFWVYVIGRRTWLAADFCQPVYAAFIDEMVAFGYLVAPGYFADPLIRAAYLGSEWVGDAQGQLDESKAVDAARGRVELGISTLRRETAALTGDDYDKVRRQRDKEIRQSGPVPAAPAKPTPSAEDLDRADREERASAAR